MQQSDITAHHYDQIRAMPISLGHYHESVYSKSYHILRLVKTLLDVGVPGENVLDIIKYLETPLPGDQRELEEQIGEAYAFAEIDDLLKFSGTAQTLLGFPIMQVSTEHFDDAAWQQIRNSIEDKPAATDDKPSDTDGPPDEPQDIPF